MHGSAARLAGVKNRHHDLLARSIEWLPQNFFFKESKAHLLTKFDVRLPCQYRSCQLEVSKLLQFRHQRFVRSKLLSMPPHVLQLSWSKQYWHDVFNEVTCTWSIAQIFTLGPSRSRVSRGDYHYIDLHNFPNFTFKSESRRGSNWLLPCPPMSIYLTQLNPRQSIHIWLSRCDNFECSVNDDEILKPNWY